MIGIPISLFFRSMPADVQSIRPPAGHVFLIDNDCAILTDDDGAYLVEVA